MKNKLIIYILIALALLVALFFVMRPKEITNTTPTPSPSPEPIVRVFDLVIKEKKLVSGPETIKLVEGNEVKITIVSDESEEWHLHGYDKIVELEANVPASVTFTANVTGRFPFELEHAKIDIGVIEVQPK